MTRLRCCKQKYFDVRNAFWHDEILGEIQGRRRQIQKGKETPGSDGGWGRGKSALRTHHLHIITDQAASTSTLEIFIITNEKKKSGKVVGYDRQWKWSANPMIHKPRRLPEATALWFDPKNVTLNKDVNTARIEWEKRKRWRRGGVLSQSTYGVCRSTAHINTSTHQDREKASGIVSKHHKDDRKKKSGGPCHVPLGPSRGYTASRCKASTCPIRNRSACAGLLSCPPRLLVNIPVICKQTEFTCDYEWIHQILMEPPCKAPCTFRMHLHHDMVYTWIHE